MSPRSTASSINISKTAPHESSGGAYADLRSQFYSRLQSIYGDPNGDSSLEIGFQQIRRIGAVAGDEPGFHPRRAVWF